MAKSREQYLAEHTEYNYEEELAQFDMVDETTVARLQMRGDISVPKKKINIPKDEQWNTKKMNSKLLQGILNGDSIPKMAKSLEEVIGANSYSAIRNARTMTTEAECGGRLASYKSLDSQGVVQKKVWMATPDDRTRPTHVDIDGEEQDIDKPFSNGCMFPADGKGPAEEVWMCRCTMTDHIIGFRRKDGSISKVGRGRDATLHDTQMFNEMTRRMAQSMKSQKVASQATKGEDYAERIRFIADDVAINGLTDEKIMEAGQILADEINAELDAKKAEMDKAKEAFDNAGDARVQEIYKNPQFKEAHKIESDARWYGENRIRWEQKQYFNNMDEVHAYYDPLIKEINAIKDSQTYKDANVAYMNALKAYEGKPQENAKMLVDKLSKIREMGSDGIDVKGHLRNSRSPMRADVEYAYSLYPKSWVQASVNRGTLKIGTVNRGYYSDWASELMISGIAKTDSAKETAIHEIGHRMEHTLKEMLKAEQSFYNRRTAGESLEWLGSPYAKSEKTRKDNFLDRYMGKDYNGTAFELNSMGFQYAYFSPTTLAQDKDMQAWIFGQLALIP